MNATRPLILLFGGAGREGIISALHARGHHISAVLVPSNRSAKLDAAVDTLSKLNLTITAVDRATVGQLLAPHRDAQLLSIGFPYLLAPEVLRGFDRPLNVHPTRLPAFRGPTTAAYQILDRASETGSTVHIMTDAMDAGAIVAQSSVPLSPFDTVRSVQRKAYETEPALVIEALTRMQTPGFTPVPQDASMASTYAKRRRPKDSRIDPSQSLEGLYDQIRACDPDDFPAFFEVAGERVCIRLWRPDRRSTDAGDML